MKTKMIKAVAVAAVGGAVMTLALELRQTRYELRLEREANGNWEDTANFQNSNHIAITTAQRSEIAHLQMVQSNSVAAH